VCHGTHLWCQSNHRSNAGVLLPILGRAIVNVQDPSSLFVSSCLVRSWYVSLFDHRSILLLFLGVWQWRPQTVTMTATTMMATNLFFEGGMTVNYPWFWRFLKSTPLVFRLSIAVAVMVYLVAIMVHTGFLGLLGSEFETVGPAIDDLGLIRCVDDCGTCMLYSTVIWSKVSVMSSCVSSALAQAACSSQPTYWHEASTSSKSHLSSTMICRPTAKTTSIGTLVVDIIVVVVVVVVVVVAVNLYDFKLYSTLHHWDLSMLVPLFSA